MYKKGDRVLVSGEAVTKSQKYYGRTEVVYDPTEYLKEHYSYKLDHHIGYLRCLSHTHFEKPIEMLVLGYTFLLTGLYVHGGGWDNPGELYGQETHKVYVCTPLNTERWIKPIYVLEMDMQSKA